MSIEQLSHDRAEHIVDDVVAATGDDAPGHEVLQESLHAAKTPEDAMVIVDAVNEQVGLNDPRQLQRLLVLKAARTAFMTTGIRSYSPRVQQSWRAAYGSRQIY